MLPNTLLTIEQIERDYIVYNNNITLTTFPKNGIYIPENNGTIYIQDINTTIQFTFDQNSSLVRYL